MSGAKSAQSGNKLYSPQLLALATELARFTLTSDFTHRGQARSKTCGSNVTLGVMLDYSGLVRSVGLQASACAVGQAACAIFAKDVCGRSGEEVMRAMSAIEAWLKGAAALPDWQGIAALEPVIDHSSRHGAVILPWQAALQALSMTGEPS